MGGFNSGRRPALFDRARYQVEDSHILSIHELQARGALQPGTTGVFQSDGYSIWFMTARSVLHLRYAVRGRFANEVVAVNEAIGLGTIPLPWGATRRCFLCPRCNRRAYKLYLARERFFYCRVCQHLSYEAQNTYHGGLCYLLLKAIKDERRYTLKKAMR